jgi:multiple sugar transport system permease protein/sn-glycerol 3-phosphate transport system permease protein
MTRPRRRRRDWLWALLFLTPSLVVFVVFVFYPLFKTIELSLYHVQRFGRGRTYVGLEQLLDTANSADFHNSLGRSVLLVALTVPAGIALGLMLAVLANRPLRGIRVFRTILSSTVATSAAVASMMFLTLLNPATGFLRYGLTQAGVLDRGDTVDLFHDPQWAMAMVSLTIVWAGLGATFIIVLAALQSIPDELLEAARLDGAGSWAQFQRVTLPLLSPTLLFLSVVGVINGLLTFGEIDILTEGGPGDHTNVLAYSLYRTAFVDFNEGRAAAQSVLLFVFVGIVSVAQIALLRRRLHLAR